MTEQWYTEPDVPVYVDPEFIEFLHTVKVAEPDPDFCLPWVEGCPTLCEADCGVACHEVHQPRHKRDHEPSSHA